ncbi:MAG: AAA family ATPase, partial [Tumebacillaceae bacterium]
SMVASEDDASLENTTCSTNPHTLLKSATIYGANASGKTNVLRALETMVDLVLNAHKIQKGDELSVTPYKLDMQCHGKPSKFEIVFLIDDVEHVYGFSVDSKRVYEEYLAYHQNDKEYLIFDRKNSDEFTFSDDQVEQSVLSKRTLENALYLSIATQFNYEKTSKVFQWFKETIKVETDTELPGWRNITAHTFMADDPLRDIIVEVLGNSGAEIQSVEVSLHFGAKKSGQTFKSAYKIETVHSFIDQDGHEILVYFDLEDESKGTQKMFDLLGSWVYALQKGQILIMDELDTSLHPNLATELVKLFHDPIRNKKNAQLIFTTHNTNLLDLDIFRRDQIWFTEKQRGSTHLFSLYEFEEDYTDIERRYLVGRYGAVPTIKEGLFRVEDITVPKQQEHVDQDSDGTVTEVQVPDEDEPNDESK